MSEVQSVGSRLDAILEGMDAYINCLTKNITSLEDRVKAIEARIGQNSLILEEINRRAGLLEAAAQNLVNKHSHKKEWEDALAQGDAAARNYQVCAGSRA